MLGSVVLAAALLAPAADAAGALARDATTSLKNRPISKVVRMLEDMKVELEKDAEDDKAVYEKLDCWCATNEKEKTEAISLGEQQIKDLKASLSADAAKVVELKAKLKAAKDEYNKDWETLNQASAMRMKENKEFQSNEADLIMAVKAAGQAIIVLSKHHPEFAQVRQAAQLLQGAKVGQLVLAKGALTSLRAEMLREFLAQATQNPQPSFLDKTARLGIPGFQGYAPQSGQIFGILKQMKETFEKDLKASQDGEAKAVSDFKMLKAAKEDEMATGKEQIAMFDQEIAALGEKAAQEAQELLDAKDQLALDQEFLGNLKKKCAETDKEYEERTQSRLQEIQAVQETIVFLHSDDAFELFGKTMDSFLQVASSDVAKQRAMQRQAAAVLRRAVGPNASPELVLLATSAELDAFEKVKAAIDKMVAELGKQQQDEVEHRDYCIDEMNTNNRSTAELTDKKTTLEAKQEDLKKSIELLTEEVKSHKAEIKETTKQMSEASDTREAENQDYQQDIADQRLTQAILRKATDRMKQVYALVQEPGAPHIETSGNATDPGNGPARFTEYQKNAGGAKVVALLEKIIKDAEIEAAEVEFAEQEAQHAYELFMKQSNESIAKLQEAIMNKTESIAKAKSELGMAKTDHEETMADLEGLYATLNDLHEQCDFVLKNFDARQAARAAEMDALREAKAILSGMK